jgi:plasmid maintenance system antidote protein VapI
MPISHPPLQPTPDQTAGLLLVARRFAEEYGLPRSSIEQILAATGASRESALEIEAALGAALEALEQSMSRGDRAPKVDDRGRIGALIHEALCFVMQNPTCTRRTARGRHAAVYRQFVIELRARYADVSASGFAEALNLPVSTLDAWMRSRHGVAALVAQAVSVAQTMTSPP